MQHQDFMTINRGKNTFIVPQETIPLSRAGSRALTETHTPQNPLRACKKHSTSTESESEKEQMRIAKRNRSLRITSKGS